MLPSTPVTRTKHLSSTSTSFAVPRHSPAKAPDRRSAKEMAFNPQHWGNPIPFFLGILECYKHCLEWGPLDPAAMWPNKKSSPISHLVLNSCLEGALNVFYITEKCIYWQWMSIATIKSIHLGCSQQHACGKWRFRYPSTNVFSSPWWSPIPGINVEKGNTFTHQLWWFLGIQSYPKVMGCSITSETHIVLWFHNHSQVSQDFLGDLKNREGSPILASPLPLILSDVKNHIKSNGSTSLAPLRLRVLLKHPFWRCYFVPGKDPVNPIELDAS